MRVQVHAPNISACAYLCAPSPLQIVDKINERKKAQTLVGFIDQIFDKALIETTFAQLYANLVAA